MLGALALLVAVNGLSLNQYYFHLSEGAVAGSRGLRQPEGGAGDLLLFNDSWVQIPFDFYYRDSDRPLPEHGVPVDLFDRGVLEPKMTSAPTCRACTI